MTQPDETEAESIMDGTYLLIDPEEFQNFDEVDSTTIEDDGGSK